MVDNDIINLFFYIKDNNYILHRNYLKILDKANKNEIITYINNRFIEKSRSIKESLLRILFNINNIPKCPICGELCKFNGGNIFKNLYATTCNKEKCYRKLNAIKSKQTCLEKYGFSTYTQTQEYLEKSKQTCLEKYGVDNAQKNKQIKQKTKQTCLEKYGVEFPLQSKIIQEKRKQTCIEIFGKENNSQTNEWKNKVEQTCLEKYGVKHVLQSSQIKQKQEQTCIERFGTNNIFSAEIGKEKIKQSLYEHFGVNSYSKTDKFKKYMSSLMSSEIMRNKIYNTQKKNNSFNKSKSEDYAYELIKTKFPDTIHHYKDKLRYPFICDFYIPSLDLFIECQFGMYHNGHPYIGDNNDLIELKKINEKLEKRKQITGKNTSRYDSLIYTWTILDPKKRNIAKSNNLNFIEFWNINEVKEWINETDKKYM